MVIWWQIVVAVICIFFSGFFSGLTLGLMSIDMIDLRVLCESGTDTEKWCARQIMPLRKHGNWLLCTLLIGNTAVNSALAIVTADMFGGLAGLFASTAVILYIGEIIPQAVCYRFGLVIGAYATPFVRIIMYLTAPLSYTTALLLDCVLGGESATRYNRSQLRSLLHMHGEALHPDNLSDIDDGNKVSKDVIIEITSDTTHDTTDNHDSDPSKPPVVFSQLSSHHFSPTTVSPPASDATVSNTRNGTSSPDAESNADSDIAVEHVVVPENITTTSTHKKAAFSFFARFRKNNDSSTTSSKRKGRKEKIHQSLTEHAPLTNDEMIMLGGAFDFSQKFVGQVMTHLDDVFMLDASLSLNFKVLLLIFQSGHSRIPVYCQSRENIIGILFAKDLILLDPEDSVPIRTVLSFFNRNLLTVTEDTPLNKMLNIFCQGGAHMAIVHKEQSDNDGPVTFGVVTLEDLIEALIGQDIVDETDVYTNNLSKQRVKRVRSIDPEVLRMFDSKHYDEVLSENEVLAVASYLSSNTFEFSETCVRIDILRRMLAEIPIIECHKEGLSSAAQLAMGTSSLFIGDANARKAEDCANDETTVYSKGVVTKNAYLIIHGRLQIHAGDEGFVSEAGPWTLLGLKALSSNLYAPDYTARVIERPTRLLRISKKLYRDMVRISGTGPSSTEGGPAPGDQFVRNAPANPPPPPRVSSANRSTPSLALAAAATAMAVGLPNAGGSGNDALQEKSGSDTASATFLEIESKEPSYDESIISPEAARNDDDTDEFSSCHGDLPIEDDANLTSFYRQQPP